MSIILETSLGDLTIDLFHKEVPLISQNFIKLCKLKYYNNALFHRVERDFVAMVEQRHWKHETRRQGYSRDSPARGDEERSIRQNERAFLSPREFSGRQSASRQSRYENHRQFRKSDKLQCIETGRNRSDEDTQGSGPQNITNSDGGKRRSAEEPEERPSHPGGPTVWELIDNAFPGVFGDGPESRYLRGLPDEISLSLCHDKIGLLATANERHNENGADFYITLNHRLESLDGKHTIFGYIVDGVSEVLMAKINKAVVDANARPLAPIRIRHTLIVEDPFSDPLHLSRLTPSRSPSPIRDVMYKALETAEDEMKVMEKISQTEARSRAIALEIIGDIPDADMRPPDNVLFVCKLNPYTEEEDLETIFSQFGAIKACNIIKDWKTGDSLQYGFIEFDKIEAAENAFFKMQDVLVDDRR
eukprot:Gregarina_sp_Poly_1__5161@NODE_2732_length_1773_cov_179_693435_g1729_i0_p1_GENE_NODE_2732_length_1773_cov_179_693435_g1729_i0NODE_2732_length_1773_cov_179_693435_g1729_i0_p1_ORF_typecomplete_len418_score64_63Pro_isomerase/PF00160_21/1e31Pro_isomerase/PF00160_21/7_2e03RRM_1/PF00076_22/2_2e16RRM_5/PF13893_6/3_3e05RL/PF17797_1/0_034RRM_7/PF16367_5/0_19RRM_3/PF08777_11/8_3e03RRM_3/PF08777_11/0_11Nup35_RRM_2/PF14605_6/0_29_NODE_2732_length_1773_cov_179_693435_g1729_i03851638